MSTESLPGATGVLALADGTVFQGLGCGHVGEAVGEVCFNTAMTGYQEILTDPSYMAQIVASLTREAEGRRVPSIVFTKGGGAWLEKIAAIGCDAVGVDWTTDLREARRAVQDRVALQGNLDPSALFAPAETLRTAARGVLESFGKGPGHVFNLGHGITPGVDPERVGALVETVRDYPV